LSTMSGSTAQDSNWKGREQGEEARYINQKEQAQLAAIRENLDKKSQEGAGGLTSNAPGSDIEGGYGGQESLEDRYATTSGEH